MNIPEKIKIGGITYQIKIVDVIDDDSSVAGRINTNKCLIQLTNGDSQFMLQTFWHEILHAINMEMPEERIEFCAQAIHQVVVDNPTMFGKRGDTKQKNGKK